MRTYRQRRSSVSGESVFSVTLSLASLAITLPWTRIHTLLEAVFGAGGQTR